MAKKPDMSKLYAEARKDPGLRRPLVLHKNRPPIPLEHKGKVVGFHIPAKAKYSGLPATGTIFVSKKHRRKGVAAKALSSFLNKHPDAVSFIYDDNIASQKTHTKAGWAYASKAKGSKQQMWKKASMQKTASQIADQVLEKVSAFMTMEFHKAVKDAHRKQLGREPTYKEHLPFYDAVLARMEQNNNA